MRNSVLKPWPSAHLYIALLSMALARPGGAASNITAPENFDQPMVQHLLNTVTEGTNARTLQYGYFIGHQRQALPVAAGYALLQAAVQQETVATQRWFVLESLQAFAAFRVGPGANGEGLAAYNTLFSHASAAAKVNSTPVIARALYDFVMTLSSSYASSPNQGQNNVDEVLQKAIVAYLGLPEQDVIEISWEGAITRASDTSPLLTGIEKQLADATVPKTYRLLWTAASLYASTKPERALSLMQQAKPLLGRNPKQVAAFYDTLVNLLDKAGKPGEAMAAQQEKTRVTGHGYMHLVMLEAQSKNDKALGDTLTALMTPTADEQEINETVAALFTLRQDKTDAQAAQLLQRYVMGQRPRNVEQELRARLALGRYYMNHQQIKEAQAALTIEHIQPPLPTRFAQVYYSLIQGMRQELRLKAEQAQQAK